MGTNIGMGELRDYPLSDSDIRKILGSDISIVTYPELNNVKSINQIFDKKGRCILLFLTQSENAGHWCCLLNKADGIHFFDSYGQAPEKQKKGADPALLERTSQDEPRLLQLMKASGKPIFYNTHDYQKDSPSVNTCGRWACVRCLYAPYSDEDFYNVVKKSGMSGDNFVSALTANWIKK
jgi:hypothetical protein